MTWDDFTKRNFPVATRLYWELLQEFGPMEKIYATENGVEIGKPSDGEGVQPVIEQR